MQDNIVIIGFSEFLESLKKSINIADLLKSKQLQGAAAKNEKSKNLN